MDEHMKQIIELTSSAYISVFGAEKWNSLSDKEKHDVVMILAKDLLRGLENLDKMIDGGKTE